MNRWSDLTLGELVRGLARYRPFILVAAGIFFVAAILPGSRAGDDSDDVASAAESNVVAGAQDQSGGAAGTDSSVVAGAGEAGAEGAAGLSASTGGTVGSGTGSRTGTRASGSGTNVVVPQNALEAPDCDPVTKRMRFPSVFSAPCRPVWPKGADNGGASARGVSATEIVVAIRFNPNPDPAGQAILLAAGVDDTSEQTRATRQNYIDLFEKHYRTYGRKVKIVYVEQSGESDDDQAARADAVRIATEVKAFAVFGGSGAFKDELVARGVLCIGCTTSEPIETYLKGAPYVWGTLMASTQAYVHRAEYVGKRLGGANATFAGDPLYQGQKRKLGLVYLDTTDGTYTAGINFFEKELARYGIKLTTKISYLAELETAQEQARVIVAKLKDSGVTSVIFSGDPIAPAFLTKEATNQQYRPEWIITGSALTDTSLFARTYDQAQWAHAFGVSMLAARGPFDKSDAWRLHVWHHGSGPPADDAFGVIYPSPFIFMTGVHLAGPKLTVSSFRDGLFSYPVSGKGLTTVQTSFGRHGIWQWDDYLAYDDMTEIWWDPQAVGEDETGKSAPGLYRYVAGGKRYAAGEWPKTPAKPFDAAGSVTVYAEHPAADKWPDYEHKHFQT